MTSDDISYRLSAKSRPCACIYPPEEQHSRLGLMKRALAMKCMSHAWGLDVNVHANGLGRLKVVGGSLSEHPHHWPIIALANIQVFLTVGCLVTCLSRSRGEFKIMAAFGIQPRAET